MMKRDKEGLIYKMDIPWSFYVLFIIPFAVAGVLFLLKADYEVIIIFTLLSTLLTLNTSFFIIEVYEDYFKIILPSIWFDKLLRIERKFYYDKVGEYECEIGGMREPTTKTDWAMVMVLRMLLRPRYGMGSIWRNAKFSQLSFVYNQEGAYKTISRWFSSSQTEDLTEASKHIKARLKQEQ